jgi:hypothetical protein
MPSYWRGRPFAIFLNGIPGEPEVWVNGTRVAEKLRSPARIDIRRALKLDGYDTLTLVYDRPPEALPAPRRGGMAAVHWETWVALPRVASGSTVWYELGIGAESRGIRDALGYASEILAVSSTPFELNWAPLDSGAAEGSPPGALLTAIWSASPFSSSGLSAAEAMVRARLAAVTGRHWIMTPPTAGSRQSSGPNQRLALFSRRITAAAEEKEAGIIPVFHVFQCALKAQRRWPARPDLADQYGSLTPAGSYLAALAIIEGLSLGRE